jgi:sulfide:quinone oxidoreductase
MTPMRSRVLIAGGGIGAVEAALSLREHARDLVDVTLLAPGRALQLAPDSILEAAGGPPAPRYDLTAIAADLDVTLVEAALDGVDAAAHRVTTRGGATLGYDALLLALGAMPGATLRGATRFAGGRDVAALKAALAKLRDVARPRIAFVATGGVAWTLPLYELALLVAARFDAESRDRRIITITPEPNPLAVFGREASRAVAAQLTARHIDVRTGTLAESVEDGHLWFAAGGSIPVDLVIALPEAVGPSVPGLPVDQRGFVPVDRYGRVTGTASVWAAGDMTARPLKQGGLAAQQADVAAQSIAAWAGAEIEPEPYDPVLRGLLLTGAEPRFLRRSAISSVPSTASEHPLWWPASKVVGPHLSRYLAAHESLRLDRATP